MQLTPDCRSIALRAAAIATKILSVTSLQQADAFDISGSTGIAKARTTDNLIVRFVICAAFDMPGADCRTLRACPMQQP
jgi:hypothetical protein